jgi:hypothetical protein
MSATSAERRAFILPAAMLGDAIGYPINGVRAGHVKELLGEFTGVPKEGNLFPDRPERFREAGLHSALGQKLFAIASAFEPDELQRSPVGVAGARLLELAGDGELDAFGALRHAGRPLLAAAKTWRDSFPWDGEDYLRGKRGSKGVSGTIAGLVIVASGRGANDPTLPDLVRLTHGRFLPLAGAYAVARLTELLLESSGGKKIDAHGILDALIADLRREEAALIARFGATWSESDWEVPSAKLSDALEPLGSLLREENDKLTVNSLLGGIERFGPDCAVTHAAHGFIPVSLPWVIYRALGSHSPATVIESTALEGGEACAIGALTAGLLAARYGAEYFPEEWFEGVRANGLAREASRHAEGWPDRWLAAEKSWSAHESATRAKLVKARGDAPPAKKKSGGAPPPKPGLALPPQEPESFAPPPAVWLRKIDPDDPLQKHKLKESRGKKRIGWKEDRRRGSGHSDEDDD